MDAEAQIPARPPGLAEHLGQRVEERLGKAAQFVAASAAIQLVEHGQPVRVDRHHPVLEDGVDQLRFGAEVVAHGAGVALPGLGADLPQGDAVHAALGEQALGRLDQPGRRVAVHKEHINSHELRQGRPSVDMSSFGGGERCQRTAPSSRSGGDVVR